MTEDELMTYSKLRKIQKEEQRKDELVDLNDKFLLSLSNYLETKKKHSEDKREFKNAKRVFEKIISIREDKITEKAKISAKTNTPTNIDLLPEEEKLFRKLKEEFSRHKELLDQKINVETGDNEIKQNNNQKELEDEEQDKDNTDNSESEEEVKEDQEIEEGYVAVRIKEEVPEFMGTDLETYGPLEEGETVEIPEDNAEILINRGKAEEK